MSLIQNASQNTAIILNPGVFVCLGTLRLRRLLGKRHALFTVSSDWGSHEPIVPIGRCLAARDSCPNHETNAEQE